MSAGRGRTRRFVSLAVLFVCLSAPAAGADATAHSRTIVFSVFSGLPVFQGDERCEGLYSVEADGSDLRRLTAPGASGNSQLFPSLARNGRTLLFARFSDAAGNRSTLYRLDGDDGAVVGLVQVRSYPLFLRFPWSPRGPYVLIPHGRGTSRLEIQRLDARNGRRLRLTAGAGDLWPTWSPDGAAIAFTRRSRASTTADAVWLMAADGRHERLLTNGRDPIWSPDGHRLACFRPARGREPSQTKQHLADRPARRVSWRRLRCQLGGDPSDTRLTTT